MANLEFSRIGLWWRRGAIAGAVAVASACGQGGTPPAAGDLVLVQVRQTAITLRDLEAYEAALPERYRATGSARDVARAHLQGLVDRELMVQEARARGMDRRPDVVAVTDSLVHRRMAEALLAEHVTSKVAVTVEELREAYERHELGWQVWPAHLLSATEEEAWEAHRLLKEGADFATLARERSQADDAERGGELRQFFNAGDAVPELWKGTADLAVDEFSEPIRTLDGWEIVKILDRDRVPFERMRGEIEPEARRRRWAALRQDYLAALKERFAVTIHEERADRVLAQISPTDSVLETGDEEAIISWQGGKLSVAEAANRLRRIKHGMLPADAPSLVSFLGIWVLPDTLLGLAGREAGLDRAPEMVRWRQEQLDLLSVEELRRELLAGEAQVSEEELRRFYRDQTDRFSLPGRIFLTEVLVDSREEAQEVLDLARGGTPLEKLARERSVRPPAEGEDRHMHMDAKGGMVIEPLRSSPYHTVFSQIGQERVGELLGPIEMEGRFAVVRLDQPIEPYYVPYERVRRQVAFQVKKQKVAAAFEKVIAGIRARYADQITWLDDHIAMVVSARSGG